MDTTEGTFRVYRVVDAVAHLNVLDVDAGTLYTVYESAYPDTVQRVVDDLTTGDLVTATLEGDSDAPEEPWRFTAVEPAGGVTVDFVTGVAYPDVARETWAAAVEEAGEDPVRPTGRALGVDGHDGAVAEVWVQPRDALPDMGFIPSVLAGKLPLEPWLQELPYAGGPASELLVVDATEVDSTREGPPYGVLLFFTEPGRPLADRYRERWGVERGADSRPDFDPY